MRPVPGGVSTNQGRIDAWFPVTHLSLPHGRYEALTEAYWTGPNNTQVGYDMWNSAYTQDRGHSGYTNSPTCSL